MSSKLPGRAGCKTHQRIEGIIKKTESEYKILTHNVGHPVIFDRSPQKSWKKKRVLLRMVTIIDGKANYFDRRLMRYYLKFLTTKKCKAHNNNRQAWFSGKWFACETLQITFNPIRIDS